MRHPAYRRPAAHPRRAVALAVALLASPWAPAAMSAQTAPTIRAAPGYVAESWTVADGLPVNSITAITQTRDGYLWIATRNGLVRFDGVRFTVFDAENTPELPSNRFLSLFEDRTGTLWALTEQRHLVRYRQGRFLHVGPAQGVRDGVLRIDEAEDGTLLVVTTRAAGLLRGDRFEPVGEHPVAEYSAGIVRARDGSIWIGANRQLWRFANGRAERVPFPEGFGERFQGNPGRLALDPAGRLWLGGEAGVWVYDGGWRRVRVEGTSLDFSHHFVFSQRADTAWVLGQLAVVRVVGNEGTVLETFPGTGTIWTTLVRDSAGHVWYADIDRLVRDGRVVASAVRQTTDKRRGGPAELGPHTIQSLFIDREGSVWFGTSGTGLHRVKPSLFTVLGVPEGLQTGNVYPVYEDPWGAIWAGMHLYGAVRLEDGGARLTHLVPSNDVVYRPPFPPDFLPAFPRSFLADRPDRLWIGSGTGIFACTLPAVRCTADASPDLLGDYQVQALHRDAQGTLWAGTAGGVLRRDGERWSRVRGWPLRVVEVRGFVNAPDGALWMATGGGGLIRHANGRFAQVTTADGLPGDVVRALHVDAEGWLWVGTEGRGLARLDPRAWSDSSRSRAIARIGTEHGLFDGGIHVILPDDDDRFWMSTNRGIFWVPRAELMAVADGRAREVHSTGYTERDGLRNREGNGGVQWPATRTRDGKLWFATQDGLAIVDPRQVTARQVTAPVLIERVVANDSVHLPQDGRIRLGVDARDLAVEFTALSLLEPRNLRFRYRLEPYDADWVEAGSRRVAFYTKVPPGPYTFRVQARTPDGAWTPDGATLTLALAAQPWETLPFRLAVLGLLAAAAVAAARWWSRRVRERAAQLETVVADRTAALREREHLLARQNDRLAAVDGAKTRFFANVSHEFRTPLTLTIGPLEDVRERLGEADPATSRALDMALRNARRLLRLVNQILDVAKLEAGHMRLKRRPLDLAGFVRQVVEAFAPAATAKGLALEVDAPASVRGAFDTDAIEKIVGNLVGNAIKFTPGGGRVGVTLQETDAGVLLRVTDTGPGIAPEHLARVFERFYQTDDALTRAEPGTGIGLALVQELVALHGGTIAVSSGDLAPGAVFTVTLPLGEPDADTGEHAVVDGDAAADVSGPAPAPAADGPADADVPTLLIVDDSADLRAYVRSHFAARFRVLEAVDGADGIAVAQRELPDMVICDLMMPGTDGHTLVRTLRASPDTDFLPIVLLTAHTAMEQRLAGLEGGADDYLTKPFDMRELAARVDNLIALRRRLRERQLTSAPTFMPDADSADEAAGDEGINVEPPAESAAPVPAAASAPAALNLTDRLFAARVRAAIDARLADPTFGVAELAHAVSMDRSHLFRRVRTVLGATPSDLIRQTRLARAAAMLGEGGETVAAVAYAVGFNSVSHFCRTFQAAYGVTPATWRTQAARR